MVINSNTWHARLYLWISETMLHFLGKNTYFPENVVSKSTNLCSYIQTLTVTFPFLILVHALTYIAPILALIVVPLLLGLNSVIQIVISAVIIVLFIGFIIFIAIAITMTTKIYQEKKTEYLNHLAATPPGFIRLFFRWIKDKHDGICSIITLRANEDN